jgi:hypothetical protein
MPEKKGELRLGGALADRVDRAPDHAVRTGRTRRSTASMVTEAFADQIAACVSVVDDALADPTRGADCLREFGVARFGRLLWQFFCPGSGHYFVSIRVGIVGEFA